MVVVVEIGDGPGTTAAYARAALGLLPGARCGDTLPDVEVLRRGVTVDRGHLAAYDRVCGFRLTDTLPATYPHVLAFPLAMRLMTMPGFPFPLIGLVHLANRITVRRPLSAGATFDLSVHATELRDHPRGRRFDVVATATAGGAEVWRGVSTYLRLGGDRPGPRPVDNDPPPSGGAVWRVPSRAGGDYAAVSGDRNPIHTSRLGARLFGFPRPIAHGMWTKARCLAALEGRLPDAYTVDVSFKKPLLLPGSARFAATPAPDGWTFTVTSRHPHLTGFVTH
ncbi:MaoC/PaaZ C-terminal domain-containing protein [Actinoplanes sp. NPDC049802]|uniref:MaoC/PaaZ C-terminal domain-containing protein n=1 Tax=Actinoplanes sp. NPDC049802 TaxID=3154742 RepID=UPI0034027713